MNNGLKVVAGIAITVGIIGGGAYFISNKAYNEKKIQIETLLAETEKKLPPGFRQSNLLVKDNFNSNGTYTLSYTDPKDSKNNLTLNVDYNIKHSFINYLSKSYPVEAVAKLSGELPKEFNIAGKISTIKGKIDDDGSFNIYFENNPINLFVKVDENTNDVFTLKAERSKGSLYYDKTSKTLKNSINYPSIITMIESNDKEMTEQNTVSFEKISLKQNFTLNDSNLNIGSLDLNIDNIKTTLGSVSGFSMNSKTELTNNNYDLINKLKANKIEIPALNETEAHITLNTSIKGINKNSLEFLVNSYENLQDKLNEGQELKFTEENKKEFFKNTLNILKTGLSVNIDELLIKGKSGLIEADMVSALYPVNSFKNISLNNNLKFNLNLTLGGEMAPAAGTLSEPFLINYYHPESTPELFKLNILFDKNNLMLNTHDLNQTIYKDQLNYFLHIMDEEIQKEIKKYQLID